MLAILAFFLGIVIGGGGAIYLAKKKILQIKNKIKQKIQGIENIIPDMFTNIKNMFKQLIVDIENL